MSPIKSIRSLRKKRIKMDDYWNEAEPQKSEKNVTITHFSFQELKSELEISFGYSADFRSVIAEIDHKGSLLIYLESMVDTKTLKETTPDLFSSRFNEEVRLSSTEELASLCKKVFGGADYQLLGTKDEICRAVLNGSIVIAVETIENAISISMATDEKRSVTEPSTQTVIRGPKDGFIESLSTNVSLIRRRIRNRNLYFESFIIGEDTQTTVYMGYIKGIANEAILQEVRNRLKKIKVSAIFESGNIEELITDKTFTIFPLALNTERPDTVASNLIDGKIVILIDGTPFCLLVPAVFVNFFEISEDYYQPFLLGTFLRGIRYLAFMIALLTPSLYVGILTFHHELLPTTLLLSVIAQRQGVPFPAVIEVLIMEITFEILREAGVRMPKTVGQMVSIVGALVIGQAAAEAGIISNIMIIVVAITAIANFVSPVYSFASASRLLRFLLVLFAYFLGLYGVLIVLVAMVAHLSSLRSFGVPYLSPIAPIIVEDQKDVFLRFPFWAMKKRPKYLRTESETKVFSEASPSPPQSKGGNNA
ncbi:spore germination protein [Bacillus sp. UNC438CL73TsuS30]|uniref:spore germination protein n=1 Tax=Bacillus sp. UNC438CL73TsuS30 TaxID=1340434 RepID=UPI00047C8657|nr:spore germination protein [Bacillus sp. UNC438CL73TsuS30]